MSEQAPISENQLREDQMQAARALGLSLEGMGSDAADKAIADAFYQTNRSAVDAMNSWVADHGLPLKKHRVW